MYHESRFQFFSGEVKKSRNTKPGKKGKTVKSSGKPCFNDKQMKFIIKFYKALP